MKFLFEISPTQKPFVVAGIWMGILNLTNLRYVDKISKNALTTFELSSLNFKVNVV